MLYKTTIKTILITGMIFIFSESFAQTASDSLSKDYDAKVMAWLKELYEPGVKVTEDSIIISKESERLLNDKDYRQKVYPVVYSWEDAKVYIQQQDIKKALWYFINLFMGSDQDKELVIKSLLIYDKVFKMDKALVSSFYTYCFADPEIGTIDGGHSKITAPHVMEKKLNAVKSMLFFIDKYRSKDSTSR